MTTNKYFGLIMIAALLVIAGGFGVAQAENSATTTGNGLTSREQMLKDRQVKGPDLARIKERSAQEIDNRIQALNKLSDRVNTMKKVSDGTKTGLDEQVKSHINGLKSLKDQIATSTDAASALEKEKSITKDHRIYNLVVPQGYLVASADRINGLAQKMRDLVGKLNLKIAELKAGGKDTAALEKQLADLNGQIASYQDAAKNIESGVSALAPDQGDKNIAQNNHQKMLGARDSIKKATDGLKEARTTANHIAQQIRSMGVKTSVGFDGHAVTNPAALPQRINPAAGATENK